jgi:hypothetical protein
VYCCFEAELEPAVCVGTTLAPDQSQETLMSLKQVWGLWLLVAWTLLPCSASAATYYADYATGSDANNGTSKVTPWKRAPGMYGCANTCASTTPQPGDSFILKGGVTWPNAALGWLWTWSGNATEATPGCTGTGCIYIGVDQTWYTGGAWTRPILNAGGTAVATRDTVANVLLRVYANYLIIDNIEFTGLYWTGRPSYGSSVNLALPSGTPGIGTNIEIKNIYIHGWSHDTYSNGTSENPCAVIGDTAVPNNNANTIIHDSVIDGSDMAKDSCSAIFGSPPYIEHNYINNVSSGLIINGPTKVDGNTITNLVATFDRTPAHTNGILINASRDLVISNNVVAHLATGTLTLYTSTNVGYTTYVYNNMFYDTDVNNVFDIGSPVVNNGCTNDGTGLCTVAGSTAAYNNTVQCGPDANPAAVCAAGIHRAVTAVTLANNHWITNATSPNGGMWSTNRVTPTVMTNVLQSKSASAAQGYNSSQSYPFLPATGGSTIGAGANLTGLCSGSLATLCSDTPVGVSYNATTHTVSVPNRQVRNRPTTGPWDVGAYESAASPAAPSDVRVIR